MLYNFFRDLTSGGILGACQRGDLRGMQMLLENVEDINAEDSCDCPPIHYACKYGSLEIVRWLVEEKGADVNIIYRKRIRMGNLKKTPLYVACERGKNDIVQYLLDKNANMEEKCNSLKIIHRPGSLLQRIISSDSECYACSTQTIDMFSPLWVACWVGDAAVVRSLLQKGAAVEEPNNQGIRPLQAAALGANKEEIRILLEHGADINATDIFGNTVLHRLAGQSSITRIDDYEATIRFLIDNNANIEARNDQGETPFFLCGKKI